MGREGFMVGRDNSAQHIPDMCPWMLLLNLLVLCLLLPYEASFVFAEVQWEPQILPHPFPVALALLATNGVSFGKSFPRAEPPFLN